MADVKENVKETQVSQKGDTQVVRERTSSASTEGTRSMLANAVWYVAGVLEVLLAFRFVLKLFGANPNSGFVDFVYSLSGFFVAPFRAIFSTATTAGDVTKGLFEPATLVAMVVYGLVGWGIVKLVTLSSKQA